MLTVTNIVIVGLIVLVLGVIRGLSLNVKEKREVEIINSRYAEGGDLHGGIAVKLV